MQNKFYFFILYCIVFDFFILKVTFLTGRLLESATAVTGTDATSMARPEVHPFWHEE